MNISRCNLAKQGRNIEVQLGDEFICPECGTPLRAPTPDELKGKSSVLVFVIAGLAAAAAAGVFGYMKLTGPSAPQQQQAAAPEAVVPPPAAQQAAPTPQPAAASAPAPAAAVPPPAPQPPETVLFSMRGSNTIGASLGPKLAAAFMADTGDTDISIVPLQKADEVKVVGSRAGVRESIVVAAHGSATAFTGLAAGDTQVGMASRRVKPAERDALANLGDLTSPGAEHVLALDGIAVIVNPNNQVSELTKAQLRDIFSGAITDWSSVGGAPGPIHVLARDGKSGTYDTFKALVLDKTKLVANARRLEDSRELSRDVTTDTAAIGFIGLPYIADSKAVAVAEIGATPLLPNRLTVATEDYPLSRRLYLYTPTVNPNDLAQRFVQFALSGAGQAIVEQEGFIPLTIKTEAVRVPDTASGRYRALVGGAQRLSTSFRFQTNSTNLDNRALRDLDRLVNFMISAHADGSKLILVGFADNQGAASANLAVSKKRAEAVSALLARRGLRVTHVAYFGSELPVADNSTDDGREKNRRVEVYLTN